MATISVKVAANLFWPVVIRRNSLIVQKKDSIKGLYFLDGIVVEVLDATV